MEDYFIHNSAIADAGANIGKGSRIWHFCHIMNDSEIGDDCVLGQNVFVASGVKVGNKVKIQNNVSLYTGVICEDEVFLGPSMVFTNVINPRSGIERKDQYKKTLVKKGATIGANATILCGITIGKYAFIGAGTVVLRDVPDYALIVGNPGIQKGWISEWGHRLSFNNDGIGVCPESREEYQLSNNSVKKVKEY
jgi:UDP-2-acetamido-3-amino-2,3-dideoxy-glucuronate N-acetyltransferase